MDTLHLKILTPRKVVIDESVVSVTAPSESEGEITILPKHTRLLTVLREGIITIRKQSAEDFLAVGGGYLETDGKELKILVSRAYHHHEVDEAQTKRALEDAKKAVGEQKDHHQRLEAASIIRRSLVDLKLLKKRKSKAHPPETQGM